MEDLVSIIIPVYNAERFIRETIDTVNGQTYKNWELLLIDDGSTDLTCKLCDNFAKNDKRIKVIHKKNEGASIAKNTGIEISSGKYITFIDSDDFVEPNYIETILNRIKLNKDLYVFDVMNDWKEKKFSLDYEGTLSLKDIIQNYPYNFISAHISHWVWNKVFKKTIIEKFNILFTNLNYAEDEHFCLQYISRIDEIYFINELLYHYCETDFGLGNTNTLYGEPFNVVANNNFNMFLKYDGDLEIIKRNTDKMYRIGMENSSSEEDKEKLTENMKVISAKIDENINKKLSKKM